VGEPGARQDACSHVEQHAVQIVEWASKLFETETLGAAWIKKAREAHGFKSRIEFLSVTSRSEATTPRPSTTLAVEEDTESGSLKAKKLSILKRNMAILEMQVAALGINAPPHIVTQLEDTRNEIRQMEHAP
jgi:hypothetical protein